MKENKNMHVENAMLAVINLKNKGAMEQIQKKSPKDFVEDAAAALQGKRRSGTIHQNMDSSLGAKFCLLQVQYNPKTLSLEVSGENTILENPQAAGSGETVHQESQAVSASLNMEIMISGEQTRTKTNGFLGMLGQELTRQVIFCWGNMVFPGEVTNLSSSYTMFSPDGEPMMGKISLTISQESQGEATYWKKAFDRFCQSHSFVGERGR